MSKQILQVLSNLKHNGDTLRAGSFIEAELGEFGSLISDGVLKVIEGANTPEEAAEIVSQEQASRIEAGEAEEKVAPQDTWAPTKEPVVAPDLSGQESVATTEQAPAATLAKFNVLQAFEVTNPESKNFGKHAVGEIIEADPAAAQALVDKGTLSPVETPSGDNL